MFSKIQYRVIILVLLFVLGLLVLFFSYYRLLDKVKVGGPIYQNIEIDMEVVADVLPPPQYIVESYLTVFHLTFEHEDDRDTLFSKLLHLKDEYYNRHSYWNDKLEDEVLRRLMLEESFVHADKFFSIVESEFIPALNNDDHEVMERLLHGELHNLYENHYDVVEKIVVRAKEIQSKNVELRRNFVLRGQIVNVILLVVFVLVFGIIAYMTLISIRRSEKQLRGNEKKHRLLISNTPDLVFSLNSKLNIELVNESALSFFEMKESEVIGIQLTDLGIGEVNAENLQYLAKQSLNSGEPVKNELQMRLNDCDYIFEVHLYPIDSKGEDRSIGVICRNITEQKLSQEILMDSENALSKIFDHAPVMMYLLNEDGEIQQMNHTGAEVVGMSTESAQGLTTGAMLSCMESLNNPNGCGAGRTCEDCGINSSVTSTLKDGESVFKREHSFNIIKNDEIETLIILISTSIVNIKGEKNVLVTIDDITDRKLVDKKLLSAVIETQESERKRFAQDLHDGLGSLLSSVNIYLSMIIQKKVKPNEVTKMLEYSKSLVYDAIVSTREISNNLRPTVLTQFGLIAAIKSFCDEVNSAGKVKIKFDSSLYGHNITNDVQLVIFRVVQELINNSLKHADATSINLDLISEVDNTTLAYVDDGKGFNYEKVMSLEKGAGIRNIQDRIKALDGTVEFISNEGKGLGVKIII